MEKSWPTHATPRLSIWLDGDALPPLARGPEIVDLPSFRWIEMSQREKPRGKAALAVHLSGTDGLQRESKLEKRTACIPPRKKWKRPYPPHAWMSLYNYNHGHIIPVMELVWSGCKTQRNIHPSIQLFHGCRVPINAWNMHIWCMGNRVCVLQN